MKIFPTFSLELTAYVSREEIEKLPTNSLDCVLKFRDRENKIKENEIDVTMKYGGNQREHIEVQQIPNNVYFGEANQVTFSIHYEIRQDLLESGHSGGRFYSGVGKLIINIR